MKRIYILRHAKSDWNAPHGGDHERPLNPRGIKAAKRMGRFLARAGHVPDAVLSSTAVRARSTVELAMAEGAWECPVRLSRALYEAAPETVFQEIRGLDPAAESVLLAGHEPTWSRLVSLLAGGGAARMVTAAVACLDVAASTWNEVAPGRGELLWLVTPRLLEKAKLERDET